MSSLVGPSSMTASESREQNHFDAQSVYMDDSVVSVCRMLLSKEKEMSPSRLNSAYARLVIEKLFQNKNIDLCRILPPDGEFQSQHPYHLVHEVINSRSSFFETILEADDGLSNELWLAICQQADTSQQSSPQSADSVLMQVVSFYVTRLLPTEVTPCTGRAQFVGDIGHRKHTPLDLFLPTSPVLNSVKLESQEFFSSSLHPRHLTIFCNFVTTLCSTSDFPSTNRLMLLRYLLKQFHIFCLYDVAEQEMLAIKSSLHCRPPFSPHLYTFMHSFLEQCPTSTLFRDLVQCWMTFCRPWRYASDALLSSYNAEFLRGPWMPFILAHEKFYRVLLGKILRRVTLFEFTTENIRIIRAAVEFSWKDPMAAILRELGVNPRPHTRQVLEMVAANLRPIKESITRERNLQNNSFWDTILGIFGTTESPLVRNNIELVQCCESLLGDADSNMGTHFMAEVTKPLNSIPTNVALSRTPTLTETPKRAPRLLPDHVKDPVTGLMYLTDLGRRQVWSGERKFDFSICSQYLPHWRSAARPYEFPPLVALLTKVNEYLNRTAVVQAVAQEYSKDTLLGAVARKVMDPPCPNPSSPFSSPVFSKTVKVTPPALRIRILANYGVLLSFIVIFLIVRYGTWALILILSTSFICAVFCMAADL